MSSSFCKCIFSKHISIYAISNDQGFNDTLTNDIVSFEQLGPGHLVVEGATHTTTNRSFLEQTDSFNSRPLPIPLSGANSFL